MGKIENEVTNYMYRGLETDELHLAQYFMCLKYWNEVELMDYKDSREYKQRRLELQVKLQARVVAANRGRLAASVDRLTYAQNKLDRFNNAA